MALDNSQIVQRVHLEFQNALGSPTGDISIERGRALDYYQRKLFGNEEEGESAVVTSDVADVIDGTMPSLLRIFTTGDNLLNFDPVDITDEQQADQASDYVNYVFFKRNQSFMVMFNWMLDALMQKVGYVQCYWDEAEEITTENYSGLTIEEVGVLLDDEELEPVEREERVTIVMDPETGEETEEIVHDIKFRRTRSEGKVTVENVPPDEMRISADAASPELIKIRMVGRERYVTRDFLNRTFYDDKKVLKIIKDLTPEQESLESPEQDARKDKSDDQRGLSPIDQNDKSQDKFRLRVAYMDIDVDENGKAEYKEVWTVNDDLLFIDDCDRHPFHAICPHPLPHKHFGMATAEKVMDNQLITSTLLRQILNNLYRTNQPGAVVWEKALGQHTMSDLLTKKVGRVARFSRPVDDSTYRPDTVPFTAAESFPILEYFDRKKQERTGTSNDGEGLNPESLKHIQKTVMADQLDVSKAKIETIARIFAETGFKTLFLHIHELVLKHQNKRDIIKLRGKWVPVDPTQWRHRRDMTVQVGLGVGTREQNRMNLDAIWERQLALWEMGGRDSLVSLQNLHATAREYVKNANFKDPAMFFTDPQNAPAPMSEQEQQKLQQQQQALQQYEQQLQQREKALNEGKFQLDQQEAQWKHEREIKNLEQSYEKQLDETSINYQKLQNALTELGIKEKTAKTERFVRELLGRAQAAAFWAQADQSMAQAEKSRSEAEATKTETDAAKSGLKQLAEDIDEMGEIDDGDT